MSCVLLWSILDTTREQRYLHLPMFSSTAVLVIQAIQALVAQLLWVTLTERCYSYSWSITMLYAPLIRAQCDILSRLLPNITSQLGSTAYTQQEAAYWSIQQANTQPTCRTQPQSALDVAATVLITKFFKCQFAVKSGGHAAFVGASNIQNGLTIDLANLNEVQVSDDRTLTSVGAGNRWVDVYSKLDPQQLSVIGGRVADIGVGGLTLGGKKRRCDLMRSKPSDISRWHIILFRPPWLGLWQRSQLSSIFTSEILKTDKPFTNLLLGCSCERPDRRYQPPIKSRPLLRPPRRRQQLRHRHTLRPRNIPARRPMGRIKLLPHHSQRFFTHCTEQFRH